LSASRRGERGWLLIYRLALYLAAPLISVALVLRDRSYLPRFSERLGLGPQQEAPGIWVHAVSVGEVQAAAPLVRALRQRNPQLPLTVTTFTPTGNARARALFADQVQVRYVPFDLPGAVRRFLKRVQPRIVVILETELWPDLYRECARQRIPLLLASARLSSRSTARYLRFSGLFGPMLAHNVVVAAQEPTDADRFITLGTEPAATHVTGNVKFDLEVPAGTRERGAAARQQYASGRPVWVAGSTHEGEEEAVLAAHRVVLKAAPHALLVLAPRHPPRFASVAALIEQEGLSCVRRSRADTPERERRAQVLLLDTLGELMDFYACADVAFVGGSLEPIGGHNLLEPAALAVPILTGPSVFNASEIARLLISRGAAAVIEDAGVLGARVAALLADPGAARQMGSRGLACVEANRGSLHRVLALIEPLLQQAGL
jgi:3-deoxy-D-manno-octulosonic-acid transferase